MLKITICAACYILAGSCNGDLLHASFLELSDFTSGQALLLRNASEIEKLKNITVKDLEGVTFISMGSSMMGRKKRSSGRQSRYRFPIDDSIETLTISVKTTRRNTNGLCCFLELETAFCFVHVFFIAKHRITHIVFTLLIIEHNTNATRNAIKCNAIQYFTLLTLLLTLFTKRFLHNKDMGILIYTITQYNNFHH